MAGFFFCLASTRCRAFILPCCNTVPYKRLQWPFCYSCNYTIQTQKQFTELYSGVSVDLLYSSTHNTAAAQTAYTPPASRRRAYRQAPHLHRYQIPPTGRTMYRAGQPPYYNKVYKGAAVHPCRGSMPDSAAYRRPCQPGGSAPPVCGSLASADTLSAVQTRRTC